MERRIILEGKMEGKNVRKVEKMKDGKEGKTEKEGR